MVQVHAPQGVEVRVLSWAPTDSSKKYEKPRKALSLRGFLFLGEPRCSRNVRRFYVRMPASEQRQNQAEALPPLGRPGPFLGAYVRTAQRLGCSDIAVPAPGKKTS